jgi:hypothetical protein
LRDRHVVADEPHSFRRNRPKKKQMAMQAYRSRVRQLLTQAIRTDAGADDLPTDPARRKRPRSIGSGWGTAPMFESVQQRLGRRMYHETWHLFASEYNSRLHQRSFAGLLGYMTEQLVTRAGEYSWGNTLAAQFATLLGIGSIPLLGPPVFRRTPADPAAASWLSAFLDDEPAWRPRLQAWIARMASAPSRRPNPSQTP